MLRLSDSQRPMSFLWAGTLLCSLHAPGMLNAPCVAAACTQKPHALKTSICCILCDSGLMQTSRLAMIGFAASLVGEYFQQGGPGPLGQIGIPMPAYAEYAGVPLLRMPCIANVCARLINDLDRLFLYQLFSSSASINLSVNNTAPSWLIMHSFPVPTNRLFSFFRIFSGRLDPVLLRGRCRQW